MTKCFELLDSIPNHEAISRKLYEYTVNHTDVLNRKVFVNVLSIDDVYKHIPELKEAVAWLGLEAFQLLMLCTVPNDWYDGRVHVDAGNAANGARMIWPVSNCIGAYTRFYNIDEKYWEERLSKDESSYAIFMNIDPPYTEIDYYELTAPGFINTQIPHAVWCNRSIAEPRLTASLTFKVPPTLK